MATTQQQQEANARVHQRIAEARELDEAIREAWTDLRVLLDQHRKIIDHIENELPWIEPAAEPVEAVAQAIEV